MPQIKIARDSSGSLLFIEGELTIQSAPELKNELLQGLAAGADLNLDLSQVSRVDVAALQVLIAAGRAAEQAGGRLGLLGDLPAEVRQTIAAAALEQAGPWTAGASDG